VRSKAFNHACRQAKRAIDCSRHKVAHAVRQQLRFRIRQLLACGCVEHIHHLDEQPRPLEPAQLHNCIHKPACHAAPRFAAPKVVHHQCATTPNFNPPP